METSSHDARAFRHRTRPSPVIRRFFHHNYAIGSYVFQLLHDPRRPVNLYQIRRRVRAQPEVYRASA